MHKNHGRKYQISYGDEGDRTPDLRNAIAALSQLSYVPNRASPTACYRAASGLSNAR